MKKFFIAITLIFTGLQANAQTKSFLDTPYLETTAVVDTLVTPDRIFLNITITEKDSKGRVSVEEQEQKMAKALKSLGINLDKQLKIQDLASNFQDYFLRQKQVLKSKQYELVVYDGKTAGQVLLALEGMDISNVYLQKTEYSKMDELELALKTMAVKKAKLKADALTKPLGQKVGPAIHIVDNSTPYYPRPVQMMSKMRTMDAAESAPQPLDVDFQQIKIETNINVTFALQ